MKRQCITGDRARPTKRQHEKPCADCPFARTALHGWLGDYDADDWLRMIHGEARIDCHTVSNQQCAGAAIFRANVCKVPRDRELLQLPGDRLLVFADDTEFLGHHR